MALLQTLGTGQGYLKAGFLGFPKSGKTFTAARLAIGSWKFFGGNGRIVFFDTEGGSEYVAEMISKEANQPLVGLRARSFTDLMAVTAEIAQGDVFIVDSITHPWRELCDSYLTQVNAALKKRNLPQRKKLEFQDWNPIKAEWSRWTDWYLNSKVHVIICGRAGFEYEMEKNDETNKRELVKTGIKMKTESEFGFEPSLLVEMEREHKPGDLSIIVHRATIIGDRFGVIDGKSQDNPTFDFFAPHLKKLVAGAHAPVDTDLKTDAGVDENGDSEFQHRRRERTILCEEIDGTLTSACPSQTQEHKLRRQQLLQMAFNTFSRTKIESLDADTLRRGLERIRSAIGPHLVETEEAPKPQDAELLFRSLPMGKQIECFGDAKKLLMGICGAPAGEAEYRRVLAIHGVSKSNQFNDPGVAWTALCKLQELAEKLRAGMSDVGSREPDNFDRHMAETEEVASAAK